MCTLWSRTFYQSYCCFCGGFFPSNASLCIIAVIELGSREVGLVVVSTVSKKTSKLLVYISYKYLTRFAKICLIADHCNFWLSQFLSIFFKIKNMTLLLYVHTVIIAGEFSKAGI